MSSARPRKPELTSALALPSAAIVDLLLLPCAHLALLIGRMECVRLHMHRTVLMVPVNPCVLVAVTPLCATPVVSCRVNAASQRLPLTVTPLSPGVRKQLYAEAALGVIACILHFANAGCLVTSGNYPGRQHIFPGVQVTLRLSQTKKRSSPRPPQRARPGSRTPPPLGMPAARVTGGQPKRAQPPTALHRCTGTAEGCTKRLYKEPWLAETG